MFRSASRNFLVVLLGVFVLIRGGTGAPNAQVEFIPHLNQAAVNAPITTHDEMAVSKKSESHSGFSSNALEKLEKSTYKKYPKPESFVITKIYSKSFAKIEIPRFFNGTWKLYVLPLVTRAQDPPASHKTVIHSFTNLVDLEGFGTHERIKNIRTWRLSF